MKDDKNSTIIASALSGAKDVLASELKDFDSLIEAESKKQIGKAEKKLLEGVEDQEKLSPKDLKAKLKQERWVLAGRTFAGAIVGIFVFAAVAAIFPAGALIAATEIAALASVPAIAVSIVAGGCAAAICTAVGYGAGVLENKLTPFIPKLPESQIDEIKEQAKLHVETALIGKALCKLRVHRTEGKIGNREFAEVCDALYDIAMLEHKIPEAALTKIKESAQEARALYKDEEQQAREKEKLKLEEKKIEKQETRSDRKEDLTIEQLKEEMELRRLELAAKIQRSHSTSPLEGILAGFTNGGDEGKPIDLSKLAIMQMLLGKGQPSALAA